MLHLVVQLLMHCSEFMYTFAVVMF